MTFIIKLCLLATPPTEPSVLARAPSYAAVSRRPGLWVVALRHRYRCFSSVAA